VLGLSVSLTLAFVDLILCATQSSADVPVPDLLAYAAVTAIFLMVCYLVLYGLLFITVRLLRKIDSRITAVSAACSLMAVFLLVLNARLWKVPITEVEVHHWVGMISTAILISTLIARAGIRFSERFTGSRTERIVFSVPAIIVLFVFLIGTLASPFVLRGLSREPETLAGSVRKHPVRNVILITIDTLRPEFLSSYGAAGRPTANIDRLAKDGILFENAFSEAPWTLPSFCSMMTGVSPRVHLATKANSSLPDPLPRLAEYLSRTGYYAAAIGSNRFLINASVARGFSQYRFLPAGEIEGLGASLHDRLFQQSVVPETTQITDQAVRWIQMHRTMSFFLWVHYFDPHIPYSAPGEYTPGQEPPKRIGNELTGPMFGRMWTGRIVPSIPERSWLKALYRAELNYVDDSVGRVFETLRSLNLYDDSLIILTSDHGEEFWEHGRFAHGHTVYQELLRVPLIVKPSSSKAPTMVSRLVTTPQIMPTILDFCGIRYDPRLLTVESLLKEGPQEPIVSSGLLLFDEKVAVRFDDFKYIKNLVTGQEELYKLTQDPSEQSNLSAQFPDVIIRGREILEKKEQNYSRLRRHYGIKQGSRIDLDEEAIQAMRGVGYFQ